MASDAGMQVYTATLDLTGANSAVIIPLVAHPSDLVEVGVLMITASGADTVAVQFRQQATPTAAAGGTQVALVTGPAATIVAAGSIVRKYVAGSGGAGVKLNKGDRLWATVTDATTGATDAVIYAKIYPAGQSETESGDIASTT